jgi:hypothetical protein
MKYASSDVDNTGTDAQAGKLDVITGENPKETCLAI